MYLDHRLAQAIVTRTQPSVGHDMNIMDHKGYIIGSSDAERLFTFHPAAAQAIETGQPVTVYPEDEASAGGARAGINLPIRLQGQIVGVVGITGHPDQVREGAEILKTAVEVLLEQAWLQEQLHLDATLKVGLAKRLLEPVTEVEWAVLQARANLVGVSLAGPQVALLLDLPSSPERGTRDLASRQQRLIDQVGGGLAAPLSDQQLVLFTPAPDHEAVAERLLSEADRLFGPGAKVGIGSLVEEGRELYRSYQDAALVIEILRRFDDPRPMAQLSELGPPRLAALLPPDRCLTLARLNDAFAPLDRGVVADLQATLDTFFALDLNQSQAAEQLNIHRNTLNYRLDRVEELTGLNPRRFRDAVELYLGRLLQRYHTDC